MRTFQLLIPLLLTVLPLLGTEIGRLTVFCTGPEGKYFQNFPVTPGTIFGSRKIDPKNIPQGLQNGSIRLVFSQTAYPGPDRRVFKIAYQAPVFAVHPANRLRSISSEQARAILEKNTGSWRTFDGPAARIRLYIRAAPALPPPVMPNKHDHKHGRTRPRTILEPPPLGGKTERDAKPLPTVKYSLPLRIQTESDSKSFTMLSTDPYGMACFSITRFDENRVPLLKIDNIPPTLENFRSGSYPLMTVYYLTVPERPTPAEAEFIRYVRGADFAKLLYRDGLLPELPPGKKNR